MGDFTRTHHFTEMDPPNPPKTSAWAHKQPDAPPPSAGGRWVPIYASHTPPIGNQPIVGANYYWQSDDGKLSLTAIREHGGRMGARFRRLCTLTRVRYDAELGVEVEI